MGSLKSSSASILLLLSLKVKKGVALSSRLAEIKAQSRLFPSSLLNSCLTSSFAFFRGVPPDTLIWPSGAARFLE